MLSKVWDLFNLIPPNKAQCSLKPKSNVLIIVFFFLNGPQNYIFFVGVLCTHDLFYSNNTSSMLRHTHTFYFFNKELCCTSKCLKHYLLLMFNSEVIITLYKLTKHMLDQSFCQLYLLTWDWNGQSFSCACEGVVAPVVHQMSLSLRPWNNPFSVQLTWSHLSINQLGLSATD